MALRRPLIAGLGTTGVLVVFAFMLLTVVGALLGFRPWPGNGTVGDTRGIAIKDAQLTKLAPVTLSFAAPGTASAATSSATQQGKARRSRAHRGHDAQGVAGVRRTSERKSAPAAGGSSSGGSPGSSHGSGSKPGLNGVSDGVANTVNRVTQTAGGALGGSSNPTGKVVVDTGNAVTNTVKDLGVKAQGEVKLP
jgi:hypothetical protein